MHRLYLLFLLLSFSATLIPLADPSDDVIDNDTLNLLYSRYASHCKVRSITLP